MSWKRLDSQYNGKFQEILRLLVDFDERTGRASRYRDPETHYMRKAAAVANPDSIKVYTSPCGEGVFNVNVAVSSPGGRVRTSWVHEDGIWQERKTAPPEHPVHTITCLTDLVEGRLPEKASPVTAN